MNTVLMAASLAFWATASVPSYASGIVRTDPSCVTVFGASTAYILEVKPPPGGLYLNDVRDAISVYGLQINGSGAIAPLLNGTVLIPAVRLNASSRPFPNSAILARDGITVFPDPRPWSPGASMSLLPLRRAQISSYRELFTREVHIPAGVGLDEAINLLNTQGALFVSGGPPHALDQPWIANVLVSAATQTILGLSTARGGVTHDVYRGASE